MAVGSHPLNLASRGPAGKVVSAVRILVTGAAGFIGSSLSEALVMAGHEVVGLDGFLPNYSEQAKRRNLKWLMQQTSFSLVVGDLGLLASKEALVDFDAICHLAGLPGVRTSWVDGQFAAYLNANVLATQAILASALDAGIPRVVYASSSSVYGGASGNQLLDETMAPRPTSPYAVTKLSGEHLFSLFGTELGLGTVSLRFFTVYGPRQRPDMAMYRIIRSALIQEPFRVYGDGAQTRDFTFVSDVVRAIIAALDPVVPRGSVMNVGGGTPVGLLDVVHEVEAITGKPVPLEFVDRGPGDPVATRADTSLVQRVLDWTPEITLLHGLEEQVAWQAEEPL